LSDQAVLITKQVSATGTVDFTDASITENFSAAILLYTHSATEGSDIAHGLMGIGFIGVDGADAGNTRQVATFCSLEDNLTTGQDCDTGRDQSKCVLMGDGANSASLDVVANYDSSITNGVRINFTQVDVTIDVTMLLFAGLSKAAVGDCTFNDVGGTHEDVGKAADLFSPDLVIFRSSDNTVNADTANGTLALGFAVNRPTIQQVSSYINWDDRADPTDSDGFIRSDCCSGGFIGDRGVAQDRFQVTSFDSTGFNGIAIDTGGANSPQANYLALKFSGAVRISCKNITASSSTGNQTFNNFGFVPDIVFGQSTLMTSTDTLIDGSTASSGGHFVTGKYGSRAMTLCNQEGLDIGVGVPTVAKTRQEDVAMLTYTHDKQIAQRATWVGGSGTDSFTLNFTVATSGIFTALGLAFGLKETESVTVGDTQAFAAEHKLVATESVLVSDELSSRILLLAAESVLISDSFVLDTTTVQTEALGTLGVTAQPGVARASTVQAGSSLGVTAD